jgi:competence protein ComEA
MIGMPGSPAGSEVASAGQFRVYVVGQVRHPGVVTLAPGARVEDAVQAVGGATAKADLAVMNLARRVIDGERIIVPRPGEKLPTDEPVADPGAGAAASAGAGDSGGAVPGAPVDLNSATVAQLDALPGVGPVIAGRIVAWRQENGRFATVDDLSEVQGIGDATMAKLRPLVRV